MDICGLKLPCILLVIVFSCSEMALRCLCTQTLPPPPLKLCIEILPPSNCLHSNFMSPPFPPAPPAVNNDHSLTGRNCYIVSFCLFGFQPYYKQIYLYLSTAKQGDNALGSTRPSVRPPARPSVRPSVHFSVCGYVCPSFKQNRKITSQKKFICLGCL